MIKSATKVEATKENRENEAKEVEASAEKVEKSSPKGTNKKTAVKGIDHTLFPLACFLI